MTTVRAPAVAGRFYPGEASELREAIAGYLEVARSTVAYEVTCPRALIVPHAGYVYSGPVAASGYAFLESFSDQFDRVVLLGPCHHVPVDGLAYCEADLFETPLGMVPVDVDALAGLSRTAFVGPLDAAHAREHSLEVHLPFLQTVLDEFRVVPLVVGNASAEQVATVLRTLADERTLIVVSSDLSHYEEYDRARGIDVATAEAIVHGRIDELRGDRACGFVPIGGLLELSRERGWAVQCVDLRNSGDTAGPRDRVVGYGSFVVTESDDVEPAVYGPEDRRTLLDVARWAIRTGLESGTLVTPEPSLYPRVLQQTRASFVTLRIAGKLRGCMGTLEASRPLVEDVAGDAYSAAFRDPRFGPLTADEYDALQYHVSVLSEPTPFPVESEAELLERVRPGVDGLIVVEGGRRGTLLPSVWETLPDVREFVGTLKQKAGLPAEYWSDSLRFLRYKTEDWGDGD